MTEPLPTIAALLDAMTLDEQVSLLAGADVWTSVAVPRVGVPAFKVSDGPNGARGGFFQGGPATACFPVGIALAATWNPALIERTGAALAVEARHKGAGVLLAPTVNLHRGVLNGRNFECYSEDPWLTGEIGVAYIRGVQGGGVAATIKHFVGNESEFERLSISSEIGERALRELYLLPFEKAVKEARVWAVMSSYNRLDGIFACDHQRLIGEVLRGDWGFDGLVMSDWGALHSTAAAANAGLDLEMPGATVFRGALLAQAVRDGEVGTATIRELAGHVLRLAERVGAFADPVIPEERAVDVPEHRALIRRLGAEGCVLLKNDGALLPLALGANPTQAPRTAQTLALIGPNAKTAQIMGGGSATVNALHRVSPFDGIAEQAPGVQLRHAVGADNFRWVPVLRQPMEVTFHGSLDLSGPALLQKTYPASEQLWVGPIEPGIDPLNFSARARVVFTPEEDGEYLISLASAGFSRCLIDGELLIDNWTGWQRGNTYFTFGSDEQVVRRRLKAGQPVTFSVELSASGRESLPLKALRLGVHLLLGEAAIEQAVAAASGADAALVFIGLGPDWDCEGLDRPHMDLPHGQNELVRRVVAANPNTVVVLQTGGPVTMPWIDAVPAVLQAWYPGQECGHAIADVLLGVADPGGRLPQTFPRTLEDNPTFGSALRYPGVDGRVRYEEGVFIGYRHYEQHRIAPLFAFGHGLSYAPFDYGALQLSRDRLGAGDSLEVSLSVTNRGTRAGQTVVQLYVADAASSVERPPQELKAFAKLTLAAGETGVARLSLGPRAFAFFDERWNAWHAEAGEFELRAGASSQDIRQRARITLTHDWTERL